MPNHIQNRLKVIGTPDQIKEVLNFIASKDEEGEAVQIDFNKIKPMPEGMNVEIHSGVEMWVEICTGQIDFASLFKPMEASTSEMFESGQYKTLSSRMGAGTAMKHLTGERQGNVKDFSEEDFNAFIQCLKNFRSYGATTWYEWGIANWGTKWNAYGQNDERNTEDTIHFQTAWSSPLALIAELSKLHPDCTLKFDYADEDGGSNAGMITFKNGEAIEVIQPESQSKEAYDIYFELHPDSISDYKLVGNTYEYIEED